MSILFAVLVLLGFIAMLVHKLTAPRLPEWPAWLCWFLACLIWAHGHLS